MKKTIIALLALGGIASAALTEIADMEDLITGMSTVSSTSGTKVTTVAGYNQTVYSLSSDNHDWVDDSGVSRTESRGAAWINGADEDVVNAITSTTGGVVYVAAWINLASDATQYNTVFGWGESGKGFKFGVKDDDLFIVTKNRTEKVGNFSIKKGEWTLVAVGFDTAADATGENMFRIHATGTNGQMYSYKWSGASNDGGDILYMNTPKTLTYSIGSSNGDATSEGEDFDGMIAGVKVFTSTSFETNSAIAAAMGSAPTIAVPEPTTVTLSLLALAGLAARRRRK